MSVEMPGGPQLDFPSYLASMIDAEGTVQIRKVGPRKEWVRGVQIGNQEMSIIRAITRSCRALGISFHVGKRVTSGFSSKPIRIVQITGRWNYEILNTLPLQSVAKRKKLKELVNSYMEV
jgi:protein gp37